MSCCTVTWCSVAASNSLERNISKVILPFNLCVLLIRITCYKKKYFKQQLWSRDGTLCDSSHAVVSLVSGNCINSGIHIEIPGRWLEVTQIITQQEVHYNDVCVWIYNIKIKCISYSMMYYIWYSHQLWNQSWIFVLGHNMQNK